LPELPEVEITRRHLERALTGRSLAEVVVSHPRTARHNSSPEEVETRLRGRRVTEVGRKGKFLLVTLDDGQTMVAHLGMSGRFSVAEPEEERPAHTHFVARLDDGTEVRFIDPRTFGFVAALDEDEMAGSGVARLGPDAWHDRPEAEILAERLRGRTAPIKALLLDQGPISGLGNIYADEALHRAGIHPQTPAGDWRRLSRGVAPPSTTWPICSPMAAPGRTSIVSGSTGERTSRVLRVARRSNGS